MSTAPAAATASLYARLVRAAVDNIVATIETEGVPIRRPDGSLWYDIGPMVDPREHPAQWVDINRELIDLGLELGVLGRLPASARLPGAISTLVHINVCA